MDDDSRLARIEGMLTAQALVLCRLLEICLWTKADHLSVADVEISRIENAILEKRAGYLALAIGPGRENDELISKIAVDYLRELRERIYSTSNDPLGDED